MRHGDSHELLMWLTFSSTRQVDGSGNDSNQKHPRMGRLLAPDWVTVFPLLETNAICLEDLQMTVRTPKIIFPGMQMQTLFMTRAEKVFVLGGKHTSFCNSFFFN